MDEITEQAERDWSIQQVARLAGTTSRALRHYAAIGLLEPSRIGANGYRHYNQAALARLQRILLLRELGLGLPAIGRVLRAHDSPVDALAVHLSVLRQEKERLDRQIRSVELTIEKWEGGEQLMAEEMLNGFDHTSYKEEVMERWGEASYAESDEWYRSLSAGQKTELAERQESIQRDYASALADGAEVTSERVRAITGRHYDWVSAGWQGRRPTAQQFVGLGDMYVGDDRFAVNYGGSEGADYVRRAMAAWAAQNL